MAEDRANDPARRPSLPTSDAMIASIDSSIASRNQSNTLSRSQGGSFTPTMNYNGRVGTDSNQRM